jgi:serine/threonine-protein kinase TTK/MPS1
MSVVETATAAAGASTATQANKKKQFLLRVNGRTYTRIDCVGRGGSGKVYRVAAESGKMLALKRVSLDKADTSAIRGYKGEIDLLQRMTGVDRVIQLLDHELNVEKNVLSLVSPGNNLVLVTVHVLTHNLYLAYGDWRAGFQHFFEKPSEYGRRWPV